MTPAALATIPAAPFTGPALERLPGGGYAYAVTQHVRIEARHLRRQSGLVYAEFDVQCDWKGIKAHGKSLSCADLNLSSQAARRALAKHCAERAHSRETEFDWIGAIDTTCIEIIRADRHSGDVIVLDDAPDVRDRDFVIDGFRVPADAASMLIAHGDSLKSLIALYVLGSIARQGKRVLFLDWEWTAERHRARKHKLFGDERLETLRYLRCRAPLVQEADRLRRYCDEHQIEFLVVDSVGMACDGKLVDDDTARRFHQALGMLPPALCAAHVAKSSLGPDAKGDAIGPFGSVFFSNLCRASWLVKKQPGATDDVVTVGLFQQKQNDGGHPPVGLEFTFARSRIQVRNVELADVDGLAEKLPLAARIKALVKHRPLTQPEIASELHVKLDSVIKAVNRDSAFLKLVSADGVNRVTLSERRLQN